METIVIAACTLHNFLRTKSKNTYTPPGSLDTESADTHTMSPGQWRQGPHPQGLIAIEQQGSNNHSNLAKDTRDYLCDYFTCAMARCHDLDIHKFSLTVNFLKPV